MKFIFQLIILLSSSTLWACPNFSGKYSIERDMYGGRKVIELSQKGCNELEVKTNWAYSSGALSSPYYEVIDITNAWYNSVLLRNTQWSLEEWYLTENSLNITYSNFKSGSWSYTYVEEFTSIK